MLENIIYLLIGALVSTLAYHPINKKIKKDWTAEITAKEYYKYHFHKLIEENYKLKKENDDLKHKTRWPFKIVKEPITKKINRDEHGRFKKNDKIQ
jgi:regulator of replication initiation timing